MTYATLAQVKNALSIGTADTADDASLTLALAGAVVDVTAHCDRDFTIASGTPTARVFALDPRHDGARVADLLYVHDFTAATLIETDNDLDGTYETAWTAGDWQPEPLNGIRNGLAVAYSEVRAVGSRRFPIHARAATRITADWGWASVPDAVTQATIQWSMRLFKRLQSPLGMAGGPDTGYIYVARKIDPEIADLLTGYRKGHSAVGGIG